VSVFNNAVIVASESRLQRHRFDTIAYSVGSSEDNEEYACFGRLLFFCRYNAGHQDREVAVIQTFSLIGEQHRVFDSVHVASLDPQPTVIEVKQILGQMEAKPKQSSGKKNDLFYLVDILKY
jgi:hypothetical protein